MGFDYLLVRGDLQVAGVAKETVRGIRQYTLEGYHDLDHLLGENWHYRGINSWGDYAFIILDTIKYYISKWRSITVYSPPEQPSDDSTPHKVDAGYSQKFSLVHGYGSRSTFGRDTSIFSVHTTTIQTSTYDRLSCQIIVTSRIIIEFIMQTTNSTLVTTS